LIVENCTVYLPKTNVNFQAVFPGGTSDASPANRASRYEYETPQGLVELNLNYKEDDSNHLKGLTDYIKKLDNHPDEINHAIEMVNQVEMFFGVVLPEPISIESDAFQSLIFVTEQQHGFMFVTDSILTADGYLVGPMTYESPTPAYRHR